MTDDIEQRFVEAVHPFISESDALRILRDVKRAYSAPDRHYHAWPHVTEMSGGLDLYADDPAVDLRDIRLGIVFHDIKYDPRRNDNEKASARIANELLRDLPSVRRLHISSLIVATDHKRPITTRDEAIIVDLDLGVLGSAPERYAAYVDGVRKEYAFVSDEDWRKGRSAVLEGFLRRGRIYSTDEMRHLEGQARANLTGELNSLAAPLRTGPIP